jgi:hypothetical protein
VPKSHDGVSIRLAEQSEYDFLARQRLAAYRFEFEIPDGYAAENRRRRASRDRR